MPSFMSGRKTPLVCFRHVGGKVCEGGGGGGGGYEIRNVKAPQKIHKARFRRFATLVLVLDQDGVFSH